MLSTTRAPPTSTSSITFPPVPSAPKHYTNNKCYYPFTSGLISLPYVSEYTDNFVPVFDVFKDPDLFHLLQNIHGKCLQLAHTHGFIWLRQADAENTDPPQHIWFFFSFFVWKNSIRKWVKRGPGQGRSNSLQVTVKGVFFTGNVSQKRSFRDAWYHTQTCAKSSSGFHSDLCCR